MRNLKFDQRLILMLMILLGCGASRAESIQLSSEQALSLGKKIWKNECEGTIDGLTSWNKGEDFASLGIGHFIWYTAEKPGPFEESFPLLLKFLQQRGVKLPEWLSPDKHCPWPDRETFEKEHHSPRQDELRKILVETISLQAEFTALRMEQALPKILATLPENERPAVQAQFYRVAHSPNGMYALIDYVNFKGEGILPTERYNGQGWGLLEVLQEMKGSGSGIEAVKEFANAADKMLTRRVKNSPPARNEAQWLPGWRNRLKTYWE